MVDLTFFKDSDEPWGFRLAGGKDFGQPLSISQVRLKLVTVRDTTWSALYSLMTSLIVELVSSLTFSSGRMETNN